jgi:hypothetical protein
MDALCSKNKKKKKTVPATQQISTPPKELAKLLYACMYVNTIIIGRTGLSEPIAFLRDSARQVYIPP